MTLAVVLTTTIEDGIELHKIKKTMTIVCHTVHTVVLVYMYAWQQLPVLHPDIDLFCI